ncbi:T-lymphocyte activation antigen CD86-like isoform X2 [Acanthochromis polyacanthus]|uniref:T-lymphocyte activation antigen CD86-like isoform X2 n=1 Tax=Acanthochromis polyacanthus TaxID=80966 RepID=UPI0022345133|nr:T-lymphocyte activation antigen CD86-like isoform X2 [Acanthochromis polyacanthus]
MFLTSSLTSQSVTMERTSFLWAVVLVSILVFMQGSSAVPRVFVQKGKDVLLEVPKSFAPQQNDILTWKFNASNNLVRFIPETVPKIFDNYAGRVSVTNFSVKLKNLQAADSGVYEARVSGDKDRTIAEYSVTVQDPVSPVELNVDSVLSRSDSCIINATCRTEDSDISSSFRCVNQTCDQDGGEQSKTTNSGASLSIYLSNVSIFCNHSNQVSWTENMKKIQDFCKLDPERHPLRTNVTPIVTPIVIVIVIVAIIIAVAIVRHRQKRRQYNTENTENTIYATPQAETTQTQDEISPSDASCVSPTSTYSLVGPHSRPVETRDKPLPESLYATVDKPAKVEKPARPCKNLQDIV